MELLKERLYDYDLVLSLKPGSKSSEKFFWTQSYIRIMVVIIILML